ncbi:MAG: 4-hydroxybutyrate--acetyl-CoA CoA transferase [Desulfobulbaceae bacterium A2]|nr:MAG: 4-hydroxybutyrate--acetyl-CoA CoA transferase [Desulfobulbaceae bacterium A2]
MYTSDYGKKRISAAQAADIVRENNLLVHGMAMAEPPAILRAISARLRSQDLKRLRVLTALPFKHASETILAVDLVDQVEVSSLFVGSGQRGRVGTGLAHFIPSHFHQMPRIIREFMEIDVCVTTVSPMDQSGYFSFGTANDFTSTAARAAKVLIVEVNRFMPRVFGDAALHVSEVDGIVENHEPVFTLPAAETRPEDAVIGKTIADMVPDGATIQLGIGSLPSVVAQYLEGHKDLGIHTEAFGPAMVNLIKKGVVNGSRKSLHPRKHVYTLALGDRDMLDFMDNNPAIESYPSSYTNRPSVIAQNDRMISINAVLQVDLTGQSNAESLFGRQYSGTGGQLDFVRGAYDAKEGKSILAFYATAGKGELSRVVGRLEEGTTVTTPRTDTHYLVTEHGVANLKGRSTKERALAIIALAHPKFRDELLRTAEELYLM